MNEIILQCKNIKKKYKKKNHYHIAANDISFELRKGECLGIVGESGCGKSTLARIIMNLEKVDSGEVIFNGKNISNIKGKKLNLVYKEMQMVFQDAIGSLNPKMTIGESIKEYVCSLCSLTKEDKEEKVDKLLELVGLPIEFKDRYPHEISGGQCQRVAIARALSSHPKVLICDEVTSALDASVQAQVLELLIKMKEEFNISYIFITHDLALVSSFCDRVIVLKDGNIVEEGSVYNVINKPKCEYTKLLLKSILLK
ncbi:ABC transporter ATP-binding protein [Clostridium nigeriense]|uniref:ABC transporter ATP-binding protein n=1 Tax=Clostridium nigeriense TaxID=1805470 RepID=UPI003D33B920